MYTFLDKGFVSFDKTGILSKIFSINQVAGTPNNKLNRIVCTKENWSEKNDPSQTFQLHM